MSLTFHIIYEPSRGEPLEPGQDRKVAAISQGPLCGGFILYYD